MSADLGLIGLAVMGENLVLNFESRGYTVAVFNRTVAKIDNFTNTRGKGKKIVGTRSHAELVSSLMTPRKIMLMVKAGDVVDLNIDALVPLLDKGDVIIDGGNSNFNDTNRRAATLAEKGILFVGAGVSGGEEGALLGPSIMPGGNPAAWLLVKEIFQKISAKVEDNGVESPCCEWVGADGAGHYVKMVHNGIEYGDIQMICEAYALLQRRLNVSNEELQTIFAAWNEGDLDSYLIEITRDIFGVKDGAAGGGGGDATKDDYVVDKVLDTAGQKGTGKWTAISALDLGQPLTLIGESVFARCLSAQKAERVAAAPLLPGPKDTDADANIITDAAARTAFIEDVRQALFASKLVSYAQGFVLIRAASAEYKWDIDFGAVSLMWRGGCIIRSKFLGAIKAAFDKQSDLPNLMLDDWFIAKLTAAQGGWRRAIVESVTRGIPCPAMTSALAYYDGYRTARLPANLLQAQRDYFGAHTYERVDKPRGEFFHTNWTGRGGTTSSTTYDV